MTSMGRYMSPRYGRVILVSGYPVLTAVNCSQHWCPICVHCQFPVLSNLLESMRLNIDRDLVSGQLPNKSRHLDELTHTRDMVMWYWSVAILFWQLSIDHIVNVQCKRCGLVKTRLRHPSFPFDSLPYPPVQSVDAYVRSVNHVTTKRKEIDHILWVWGSIPRACGTPAKIYFLNL